MANHPNNANWPHNTDDDRFVTPLTTPRHQKGRGLSDWYPHSKDYNKDRWMQPTDIQGVKTLILADGTQQPMGIPVETQYSASADFIYVDFPDVLTPEVGILTPERNEMIWLSFKSYMDNKHITLLYDASGTELTTQHIMSTSLDIKNTMLFTRSYSRDRLGNITGHDFVPVGGMLDVMTRVTDSEQASKGTDRPSPNKFFKYVFGGGDGDAITQDSQLQRFVFGRNTGEAMFVDEYQVKSPLGAGYIKDVKDRSPEYQRGRLIDSGAYHYGEGDEGGFKSQAQWMARNNPEMMSTIVTWRGKDDLNAQLDVLRQSGYFQEKYNLVLMGHAAEDAFVKIKEVQAKSGPYKALEATGTPAYGGESIEILRESFNNVDGLRNLSNIALASCAMADQGPSCQYLAEEFQADVYSQEGSWGTRHTRPGAGKNLISNIFVGGVDVAIHQPTLYRGAHTFSRPDEWNQMSPKQRKGEYGSYGGKFKADWMPVNRGDVNRQAILDALKDVEEY